MAAPNSGLHICNLTMDLLNQETINQLDPPSNKSERLCARWYDQVRRATLRKHTWNFAIKRVSLAAMSEVPAFGYSAKFQLPTDYLRMVSIGERHEHEVDYEVENGELLLNESGPINLVYIYDHTTVAKFDPLFIEVFAVNLALRLAGKFGKSSNEKLELKGQAEDLMSEAEAVDGQERPPRKVNRSRLRQARQGLYRRRHDMIED
jgi:hypothetical protein